MYAPWLAYVHSLYGYKLYEQDDLPAALDALESSLATGGDYAIRLYRLAEAEWRTRYNGRITREGLFVVELAHSAPSGCTAFVRAQLGQAASRINSALGFEPSREVVVSILADYDVIEYTSSPYGYYMPKSHHDKICLPLPAANWRADLKCGLAHEYSHVAVHHVSSNRSPRWLDEGLAVHFENRPDRETRALYARARAEQRPFTPLTKLDALFLSPDSERYDVTWHFRYAAAHSAVRCLLELAGMDRVAMLLRALAEQRNTNRPFRAIMSLALREFEGHWRQQAESAQAPPPWVL